MKKLSLQDIKEHFNNCIKEGIPFEEPEVLMLNKLYKTIEKKDQALQLIIKNTVSGHVENIAKKALEN
jgi:hypothetical protein